MSQEDVNHKIGASFPRINVPFPVFQFSVWQISKLDSSNKWDTFRCIKFYKTTKNAKRVSFSVGCTSSISRVLYPNKMKRVDINFHKMKFLWYVWTIHWKSPNCLFRQSEPIFYAFKLLPGSNNCYYSILFASWK